MEGLPLEWPTVGIPLFLPWWWMNVLIATSSFNYSAGASKNPNISSPSLRIKAAACSSLKSKLSRVFQKKSLCRLSNLHIDPAPMKMKVTISLFALAAVLSPLTTGCGPSDEPSAEDVQDAQEELVDEGGEEGEPDPGSGEGGE